MENENGIVPRKDDGGDAIDGAARAFADTALAEVAPEGFSVRTRVIATIVCVVLGLLCFFPLAEFASSTQTHAASIEQLDAKAGNVTALIASSTAASVAITLLPGDVGSPIADKLVDLAADADLVEAAHADAAALVEADPSLADARNRPLAREVRRRFGAYFEGERSR